MARGLRRRRQPGGCAAANSPGTLPLLVLLLLLQNAVLVRTRHLHGTQGVTVSTALQLLSSRLTLRLSRCCLLLNSRLLGPSPPGSTPGQTRPSIPYPTPVPLLFLLLFPLLVPLRCHSGATPIAPPAWERPPPRCLPGSGVTTAG
ncbi:MAG TPA: hypothetical protein EYQ08_11320, partial [Planctomycetes bacterium]|nr:hypothetical protein [Planctomycetota bacterium]